jgi:GH15 family glucan-1,4-alpha-glucosidase
MADFIDDQTDLPHASYDLWEQKFSTFTYTVFVTIAALEAGAKIAERFNKYDDQKKWFEAANRIRSGAKLLLRNDSAAYRKSNLLKPDGNLEFDDTVDASSFYGMFICDRASDNKNLPATVRLVEETLLNSCPVGGVPRYEHDDYFLTDQTKLGNPWMICTLWLAQYYLSDNQTDKAGDLIDWVIARAGQSGMLAEQADPNTGFGVGVSPLVWSHSTLAETMLELLD